MKVFGDRVRGGGRGGRGQYFTLTSVLQSADDFLKKSASVFRGTRDNPAPHPPGKKITANYASFSFLDRNPRSSYPAVPTVKRFAFRKSDIGS